MTPRALLKETVYGLAHGAGLNALSRRGRRQGLAILTYHSFGPAAEHPYLYRLPGPRFKAHLAHLKAHYEVVPLAEGLARLAARDFPARPMAALTIDDGYGDNYEVAFPLLQAADVPATIFLATDYLDTGRLPWPTRLSALLHAATAQTLAAPLSLPLGGRVEKIAAGAALRRHFRNLTAEDREAAIAELEQALKPRPFAPLPALTWDQVRAMQAAGLSFGSHTQHHGWLDHLPADEIARELAHARDRIAAETQRPCEILAYPNGNHNSAVREAAARAGYRYALTQDKGANLGPALQPLALERIEIPYNERLPTFAARISGLAR